MSFRLAITLASFAAAIVLWLVVLRTARATRSWPSADEAELQPTSGRHADDPPADAGGNEVDTLTGDPPAP